MAALERGQVETKILDTIKGFVEDPGAVTREANLEELDIGSLDIVEIAQVLEDEFDIEILGRQPDEARESRPRMATVGDAIDLLIRRIERVGALPSA
jgi:acyl carrier protein